MYAAIVSAGMKLSMYRLISDAKRIGNARN